MENRPGAEDEGIDYDNGDLAPIRLKTMQPGAQVPKGGGAAYQSLHANYGSLIKHLLQP